MDWLKKTVLGMCLIISLIALQGCPECLPPEPQKDIESDMIFSGQSLNSQKSGVFIVKEDGNNLQEIIEDAEIYSGISDDGKFVFLSRSSDNKSKLVKYDFFKGGFEYPIEDTTYPVRRYAVRSKDGKYIAFFTNDGKLVSGENGVWIAANYDICPRTLPSFSPDSKWIAFIEADSLEAPFTINIVRADNPGVKRTSRIFPFGLKGLPGDAKLGWHHQDIITYSYTRNKTLDMIGIWNLDNPDKSIEYQLRENLGAFNPILSPDRTKILFTARDGNLWWRNFTEDTLTPSYWVDITKVNDNEYIAYPEFSSDGRKILYTRMFKNIQDLTTGKLEVIVNFGTDSSETRYVSDGVNRAFWRKK